MSASSGFPFPTLFFNFFIAYNGNKDYLQSQIPNEKIQLILTNMIDTSNNLIIIKNKICTSEIEQFQYNVNGNRCNIRFKNSAKTYSYQKDKVIWLTNPVSFDPLYCRVRHNGYLLSNIKNILAFHHGQKTYWHICFNNNYERDYTDNEINLSKTCLDNPQSCCVFEYLKLIAAENQLQAEDGTPLLLKQYNKIDFITDDKAAATYLNPQTYKPKQYSRPVLIYPFGCNASQQKAVEAAFENQVSVVQGPPGTGKTQTILNIIANIIKLNRTVLIVSNNNSAINNIVEKMSKYELGFIVAELGKLENKQAFIESQTSGKQYPRTIESWHSPDADDPKYLKEIDWKTALLSEIYSKQERLAIARQEVEIIKTEWQHYKMEVGDIEPDMKLRRFFNSSQLMQLWQDIQDFEESKLNNTGLIARFKQKVQWTILWLKGKLFFEGADNDFSPEQTSKHIAALRVLFYKRKHAELLLEIENLEKILNLRDADNVAKQMSESSMNYLKNILYHKYGVNHEKPYFTLTNIWENTQKILEEYPVILSTTFSARMSLDPNTGFDYVIMDEASQVSAETGVLALSCARNAIIVGDSMQLPNVVTDDDKLKYKTIFQKFNIPEEYNCANHSFLESICKVIPNIPQTLLREHYRCHPKIINFCNQKFYGNNLVIMTQDHGEKDVICAIKTVEGNHSRGHLNQREIDVIKEEVLPVFPYTTEEIGIIAPYNKQVEGLQQHIGIEIDVATVHKFQGREKDAIIMSAVDDVISSFADDPNLLNVAISRAKQKFCLVVSGNEQSATCNISDLIAYIQYNNCTISISKIRSIYDYLYKQYTEARLSYLKRHKRVSEYDSENLTYALLEDILKENIYMQHLNIIFQQPLNLLIRDFSLLNDEECRYAQHNATHIDFLIYNQVSKRPVLAIETDGYEYHKKENVQFKRDCMKNHILELYNIPLVRLSTTGSNEKTIIENKLKEILYIS